jgi:hypothetical protein
MAVVVVLSGWGWLWLEHIVQVADLSHLHHLHYSALSAYEGHVPALGVAPEAPGGVVAATLRLWACLLLLIFKLPVDLDDINGCHNLSAFTQDDSSKATTSTIEPPPTLYSTASFLNPET